MKTLNLKTLSLSIVLSFGVSSAVANDLRLDELFDSYSSGASGSVSTRGGTVYTAGEFSARFNQPNINVVSFQPPSISAGCGGVDMYGGAFGFMSSDQVVQVARAVAQGSASYFFNLAIDSVCPTCSKTINSIQSKIQQLNNLAKNACQNTSQFLSEQFSPEDEIAKAEDRSTWLTRLDDEASGFIESFSEEMITSDPKNLSATNKAKNAKGNSIADLVNSLNAVSLGDFSYFDFGGAGDKEKLSNILMTLAGATTSRAESSGGSEPGDTKITPHAPGIDVVEYLTSNNNAEKSYTQLRCGGDDCSVIASEDSTYRLSVYGQIKDRISEIYQKIISPSNGQMQAADRQFQDLFSIHIQTFVMQARELDVSDDTMQAWLAAIATHDYVSQMKTAVQALSDQLKSAGADGKSVPFKKTGEKELKVLVERLESAEDKLLEMRDKQNEVIELAMASKTLEAIQKQGD
ncbi:hypothetical protein C9975_04590 [Thalassospira xiamenensis]|nr:hypothetical protein C9975_04590 [Thalassospira xiamenensis]